MLDGREFTDGSVETCRSQWPSDLKLGSAVAVLLGLRVRILPGH